jgi:hypothetical protein
MAPTENIAVEAPRRIVPIQVGRPVPAPSEDDPSDDELLRFLDGAMGAAERRRFSERLERSPYASARLQILADALVDAGFDDPAE